MSNKLFKVEVMMPTDLYLPSLPDYVRLSDGREMDITMLSDAQVDAVADAWKAALKEHALQRRHLVPK